MDTTDQLCSWMELLHGTRSVSLEYVALTRGCVTVVSQICTVTRVKTSQICHVYIYNG